MPSIVPEGATRGWIVPIGGAENKENDRHILERFVSLSGGRDADIVVIPTANHLFQDAVTGGLQEYGQLAPHLMPEFLDTVSNWILAHVQTPQ